ncbi:MAG: hypothetical protein EAZ62_00350 [Sphingobacteriia bacterium]|nr:MAG: hypothetical protein EAZ62_00350 [Sphingobacteriia bacterium]
MIIIDLHKNSPFLITLRTCFLLGFFLCLHTQAAAQESMLPDVSYPLLEKLVFTARENYPRVKANQTRINVANLRIQQAQLGWFDFLSFSAFYSPSSTQAITGGSLTGTQLGFFMNLGVLFQKPNTVKIAREESKLAQHTYQEYLLTIESEVKQRYFRYVQQNALLRVAHSNSIDVDNIFKVLKIRFEKGEETFENFSRVVTQLTEAKQRIVDAEASLLITKTSLEELLGKKLEEVK